MNFYTKALMVSSAATMLLVGLTMTFAPQELLAYLGGGSQTAAVLLVQAAGGLFLGFSILNWMAKDNLIGGIYSRPVAMGNFLHFFIVAAALIRVAARGDGGKPVIIATLIYTVFAAWFGLVAFSHPAVRKS